MNVTGWVAVAGITGTLLAAVLAPFVQERMRRRSERLSAVLDRQLDCYDDLLRVAARLADNAATWATFPLAQLTETPDEELDRIISRMRVVASQKVYDQAASFNRDVQTFNRALLPARTDHHRLREDDDVDDARAMKQRMDLGAMADAIANGYRELEATIRSELAT